MAHRPPSLPPDDLPTPEPPEPEPVKHRLGTHRVFDATNPAEESASKDPNDVFAVRQLNLRVEQEHTDELLRPVDKTARRRHWRDYWLIIALGNGLLGLVAWFLPGVITIIYAGSGMIMLTLGVTWLYVFVLDPR